MESATQIIFPRINRTDTLALNNGTQMPCRNPPQETTTVRMTRSIQQHGTQGSKVRAEEHDEEIVHGENVCGR